MKSDPTLGSAQERQEEGIEDEVEQVVVQMDKIEKNSPNSFQHPAPALRRNRDLFLRTL